MTATRIGAYLVLLQRHVTAVCRASTLFRSLQSLLIAFVASGQDTQP